MKAKKVIAREGLILLAVVISGLSVYFIGRHLNSEYLQQYPHAQYKVVDNMRYALVGYAPYMKIMSLGLAFAIFAYPFLALVRFILWAVRTLKK